MTESKLQIVRASLASDLRVELVHTVEDKFTDLFDPDIGWMFRRINYDATRDHEGIRNIHNVDFRVAPRGGIFDLNGLQGLLNELIPQLKPDMTENFRVAGSEGREARFGKLHFYDTIGKESYSMVREVELKDEELRRLLAEEKKECNEKNKKNKEFPSPIKSFIDKYHFVNGTATIKEKAIEEYRRTVTVSLFPSKEYIQDILSYDIGWSTKLGFDKEIRRRNEDAKGRLKESGSPLNSKHPSEGTSMKIFRSYRPLLERIFAV